MLELFERICKMQQLCFQVPYIIYQHFMNQNSDNSSSIIIQTENGNLHKYEQTHKRITRIQNREHNLTKQRFQNVVNQKEYRLLKMIYDELGNRIPQKQVNKQNFLLFFHKNGYWGDRLFKQFDASSSNLITESEFIRGIVKIFKTSEEQKIKLLFKFFSGGTAQSEGVAFSQFLTMLYNYPKEDLEKVLNDTDFVNKQIKTHLVAIDSHCKGRRLESICPNDVKNNTVAQAKFRFQQSDNNSDRLQTKIGRDILKQMNSKTSTKQTTIKIKVGQNDVQVKTSSIHQLVKKFARSIFKQYKVDIRQGKLKYPQFCAWLKDHKNLYDDYYQGFHSQIWQLNEQTGQPQFFMKQAQMASNGRISICNSSVKKIKLTLLHSILLIFNDNDEKEPEKIICLQGLTVQSIFDEENGYGVQITHRQKQYPITKVFFLNKNLQEKWMEFLKIFKGSSINASYDIGQEIGRGKFSLVYQGKQKSTSQKCAIKVISKKQLDQASLASIKHESGIMSVLSHPLMVHFKETIQNSQNIYIITELVEGKDMFELVRQLKYLQQPEAAFIFKQIIVGVRYLHSLGIIHRDLKPENVMVEYNETKGQINKIKIIDFGFANYLSVLNELEGDELMAGTPSYIAPQILNQQGFTEKIDNFAIGSMLYFALCGTPPFFGSSIKEMLTKTIEGAFQMNDKHWKKISKEAKSLVAGLLETQVDERLSLDQALRHPWFSKEQNQEYYKNANTS